jgi:uncharacterized protein (TIGR03067 family)
MRVIAVAALAIVALFSAVCLQAAEGESKEGASAKDLQAFQGTWRLSSREEDGKKSSEEETKDVIATVDGSGTVTVRRGDQVIGAGTVKLDPTTKPKAVEIAFTEGRHKGKTVLGIYEIEGDSFRVCCARPGDERPTDFSAKAGSGHTLVVYQRDKK